MSKFYHLRFPVHVHHEENRLNRIEVENDLYYKDGWLPCGDNWWRFPWTQQQIKRAEERYYELNKMEVLTVNGVPVRWKL